MKTVRTDVVIIGAGGGGAVLGLALARRGIEGLVLEQAPGPPGGLRGEILQPNGQEILDRLGLLSTLPESAVRPVRHFHFCRAGGERLCTVDYAMLPPPYNRALVSLPNAVHHAILVHDDASMGRGRDTFGVGCRVSEVKPSRKEPRARVSSDSAEPM